MHYALRFVRYLPTSWIGQRSHQEKVVFKGGKCEVRFGILNGKGIMLGDIELNPNPDNWTQVGRRELTNRVSIQVRIGARGVGEAGILFDWDTNFYKPAPLHLVPHLMAVGNANDR